MVRKFITSRHLTSYIKTSKSYKAKLDSLDIEIHKCQREKDNIIREYNGLLQSQEGKLLTYWVWEKKNQLQKDYNEVCLRSIELEKEIIYNRYMFKKYNDKIKRITHGYPESSKKIRGGKLELCLDNF